MKILTTILLCFSLTQLQAKTLTGQGQENKVIKEEKFTIMSCLPPTRENNLRPRYGMEIHKTITFRAGGDIEHKVFAKILDLQNQWAIVDGIMTVLPAGPSIPVEVELNHGWTACEARFHSKEGDPFSLRVDFSHLHYHSEGIDRPVYYGSWQTNLKLYKDQTMQENWLVDCAIHKDKILETFEECRQK